MQPNGSCRIALKGQILPISDVNSPSVTLQPQYTCDRFKNRKVVVVVTGGIAAYKTCYLVRELIRRGAEVQVLMSKAGTEFVSPLTFATLSGRPVISEMFPAEAPVDPIHLSPIHWGEVMVVAPATADFIGKLAHGLADDIPSTTVMAFRGSLLIAPAMNPNMWGSPAVKSNIELLINRGVELVGPGVGSMGGVHEQSGTGRMSEPEEIIARLEELLSNRLELKGRKVLVTSGPTRERLDPVRYISNFSSGRMGDAVARVAHLRGAEVTLVRGLGATGIPPSGVRVVDVDSAAEMFEAVQREFASTHLLVMAAAVADWTPMTTSPSKIKKGGSGFSVEWKETDDILAWAGKHKSGQVVVGFALETADHFSGAERKLEAKHADMIVLNDATRADSVFGGETTSLTFLTTGEKPVALGVMSKQEAADKLIDAILPMLQHV